MFKKFHNAILETWVRVENLLGKCVRVLSARQVGASSSRNRQLARPLQCPSPSWPGRLPPGGPPRALTLCTLSGCPSHGPSAMATPRPHGPAVPGVAPGPRRWSQGVPLWRLLFLPGIFTCQHLRSAFLSGGLLESADGCELIMAPLWPGGAGQLGSCGQLRRPGYREVMGRGGQASSWQWLAGCNSGAFPAWASRLLSPAVHVRTPSQDGIYNMQHDFVGMGVAWDSAFFSGPW